jgi:uncharacterized iron-regulated protein
MRFLSLIEIVLLLLLAPAGILAHPHIVDVAEKTEVPLESFLDDLRKVQVIFIGELHVHTGHHQAQLSVIKALDDDERPLAIGLEMFRRDSQDALDAWSANEMPFLKFMEVYQDNWSMAWPAYSEIFMYARNQEVKMLGLNIPDNLSGKVAKNGFKSLSIKERQLLGNVQCEVDSTYARYIRQAMGGYGGHGQQYLFFCEAQLLWDTVMARNLIDFLKENQDYRIVVMAGSAHAWKFGIPRQLVEQADISYRVVLPEVAGRGDRNSMTEEFADYLWLDVGDDGWQF